ncbi:DUF1648 domain-containing protein [Bizionia sediminis]|uniref:DUF1648 domain-containing protein n=1 Tax=Bizionia sediminis TaxID=1737064 RepID=A0ABW5KUR4_9FLAO
MFFDNRPKIDLKPTKLDRYVDITTFGLLILAFLYTCFQYNSLPELIPMHFNFDGTATRYDSKDMIWIIYIIGFPIIYGGYYLNKFPHLFNYPTKITAENAKTMYQHATRLMRFINLIMALIFTVLSIEIVRVSKQDNQQISQVAHYIIIALVVILTVGPLVSILWHLKAKKRN